VWHGMAWYRMVWYGTARHCMACGVWWSDVEGNKKELETGWWDSIHVFECNETKKGTYEYKLTTTVMVPAPTTLPCPCPCPALPLPCPFPAFAPL
jgi:hypothetical protein